MKIPTHAEIDEGMASLSSSQVFFLYFLKKVDELIATVTLNIFCPRTYIDTFFKMVENNKKNQ